MGNQLLYIAPGHILRKCDDTRKCSFVTYAEVCDTRSDCIESMMPVSQVSHKFDWYVYKSGNLELTSLSADPESEKYSFYRIAANVADKMNSNGFGSICNTMVLGNRNVKLLVSILKHSLSASS